MLRASRRRVAVAAAYERIERQHRDRIRATDCRPEGRARRSQDIHLRVARAHRPPRRLGMDERRRRGKPGDLGDARQEKPHRAELGDRRGTDPRRQQVRRRSSPAWSSRRSVLDEAGKSRGEFLHLGGAAGMPEAPVGNSDRAIDAMSVKSLRPCIKPSRDSIRRARTARRARGDRVERQHEFRFSRRREFDERVGDGGGPAIVDPKLKIVGKGIPPESFASAGAASSGKRPPSGMTASGECDLRTCRATCDVLANGARGRTGVGHIHALYHSPRLGGGPSCNAD